MDYNNIIAVISHGEGLVTVVNPDNSVTLAGRAATNFWKQWASYQNELYFKNKKRFHKDGTEIT